MNTLPTLSVPTYRLTVPSTKEVLNYRPYMVKEEKVLMIAMESEDIEQVEDGILNIVASCLDKDPEEIKKYRVYDIEYIFLQLRSKSVGETVKVKRSCENEECSHISDVSVSLDKVIVANNEDKDGILKLSKELSLELSFPTWNDRLSFDEDMNTSDMLIKNVATGLVTIYYGEEVFDAKNVPIEERIEFIEGLSSPQFSDALGYMVDAPFVYYEDIFTCSKCGNKNKYDYTGLIDFFI